MQVPGGAPRLNSEQLAALLERVPDIVWRYRLVPNPGFEYVSSSVYEVTGYTPAEHYADPELGLKIVHPDDLPHLEAAMAAPEAYQPLLVRWRHKAGFELTTEQRVVAIRDEAGELVALEGVARPVPGSGRTLKLTQGEMVIDLATHQVTLGDRVIELTKSEHRILARLASTDGPVAASELIARLCGEEDDPSGHRVLQVHVSNLRRKIEVDPAHPRLLITHRGMGYELVK